VKIPPERLGSFFLGAEYDLEARRISMNPINYDARDLTTHGVCLGMTGSGKTGLCIGLLEEAALDRVPAILIDPKGDVTNLMLQFPDLRPEDFLPWVNPDDARRRGKTVKDYASDVADLWRGGLAEWGIGPERIRSLKESADFCIYTPGSEAGIPINILNSLAAPRLNFEENAEVIRERINGTVAALLGLVGVDVDPIRSREAILLATIFEHFWRQNVDLDLEKLILSIQNPPVRKLGVFDVDSFYPEKDRFELAMALNGLVASPSFQSWLRGEPLDIDRLLYSSDGKPRHSIFYIAHLSDRERMFFVTLLLENILTWVRQQTGTTSLRALLYFDEVFGFMPPVAEPSSKRPLLTLLKQARAFGLGLLLVTQNPVDLDYKGLTNAGTWLIGKLQTERDKERVLQGLEGAISESGGSIEEVDYDALISKLSSRVFLMHNVHEDRPVVFNTRWVMSYLRGPLTRPQVRRLMADRKKEIEDARARISLKQTRAALEFSEQRPTPLALELSKTQPILSPSVTKVFLPLEMGGQEAIRQLIKQVGRDANVEKARLVYQPMLLSSATVRFFDRKRRIDEQIEKIMLAPAPEDVGGVDWSRAETLPIRFGSFLSGSEPVGPDQGPFFSPVPEQVNSARELRRFGKDLTDWLYYNDRLTVKAHLDLDIFQQPSESESHFLARLHQAARERRDTEVDKLEDRYATRLDKLEAGMRKLERDLIADEAEYEARKREEMVGAGETVLSFFMGRRRTSAATTIARRRRMTSKVKMEIEETKEEIDELKEEIIETEGELKEAVEEITGRWENAPKETVTEEIKPRRVDVKVNIIALAWTPHWRVIYTDGRLSRTTTIPAYPRAEERKIST